MGGRGGRPRKPDPTPEEIEAMKAEIKRKHLEEKANELSPNERWREQRRKQRQRQKQRGTYVE